jgi:hypothetical protein
MKTEWKVGYRTLNIQKKNVLLSYSACCLKN